jgi:predicted GNAT family acetyltransferase
VTVYQSPLRGIGSQFRFGSIIVDVDAEITDDTARHRYELTLDGATAFVRYRRVPGVVTFIHTEVPDALGGQGIGSRLARHVLEDARRQGLKVVPLCPFIAAWMARHPEYDDLRATAAEGG